jgi:hypothetical protein
MSDVEDDVLDEAIGALREQTDDPADATLDQILGALDRDPRLEEASHALRDETARAISSDAEEATLGRIVASLATASVDRPADAGEAPAVASKRSRGGLAARVQRFAVAAAVLFALALGGSTAWAWTTGRIPAWLSSLGLGSEPGLPRPPASPAPEALERVEAPEALERVEAPEALGALEAPVAPAGELPELERAPVGPAPATREASRGTRRPVRPSSAPRAPELASERLEGVARDVSAETRSFRSAHDAHFRGGDPAAALAAWDAHLAQHPGGRYDLEARYNRALALVRLGRLADAREALAPFASGAHGAYRREDAARLIDAIDSRASE